MAFLVPVALGGSLTASGAALGASVAGAAVSGISAYSQGQAASRASAYNAQVASQNAKIATQNAEFAGAEGEANVGAAGLKNRAQGASIEAAQAANGIDVNSKSATDVRTSQVELGETDALNIRANAVRSAYGFQTQSAGFTGQAGLDTAASKSESTGGTISGIGTFLGGAGSAALNFAKFQNSGGITTDDLTAGDQQFMSQVHGNG